MQDGVYFCLGKRAVGLKSQETLFKADGEGFRAVAWQTERKEVVTGVELPGGTTVRCGCHFGGRREKGHQG